jgi:carboxyl-terminal processing protease
MKRFFIVSLAFALSVVSFAQTINDKPEVRAEILNKLNSQLENVAFVPGIDFKKWDEFLKAERSKIDEAKNDEEFKAAVNAALHKFGFSHILLATPKDITVRSTGQTTGIGVSSQPLPEGGRVILRVVEGSPAADAGLEPGDIMQEIDGLKISEATVLSGESGTKVKIKVLKQNGKVFEYTITRRPFSTVRKDEFKMLNPSTGLIKINTFDRAYDATAIDGLMKEAIKTKNLIVDLRFNGGGAVMNLLHFAGYFVDPQIKLGFMLDKNCLKQFKKDEMREPANLAELAPYANDFMMTPRKASGKFAGNLIVLINGGTGSASEIFAAAMQDLYGKKTVDKDGTVVADKSQIGCTIVGTKSAGAVLFSMYLPASNGFALQIPVADYLTPRTIRLEGNPIIPDVTTEEPKILLPTSPDKAIEAALAIVERKRLRDQLATGN